MGTGAAVVLVACGLFLFHGDMRLSTALSFLAVSGILVFVAPRQVGVEDLASVGLRLRIVRDELLTGGMLFAAAFFTGEPYTCAHRRLGRVLYGMLLGAMTVAFRYFGVYETGVFFAVLVVNSLSAWLDRNEARAHAMKREKDAEKEGRA